jgi:hypothetical protein
MIAELPSGAMVIVLPSIVAMIDEEGEGLPVIVKGAKVVKTPPIVVTTPEIVVTTPGARAGIVVGFGTIMNGVLLMRVVDPVSQTGSLETGMSVEKGIIKKGVPLIKVVDASAITAGVKLGSDTVVGPVITKKGVPSMRVVLAPVNPGGAFAARIVVALGITKTGSPGVFSPGMVMVETGVNVGGPIPPTLAIIDPIFPSPPS